MHISQFLTILRGKPVPTQEGEQAGILYTMWLHAPIGVLKGWAICLPPCQHTKSGAIKGLSVNVKLRYSKVHIVMPLAVFVFDVTKLSA